MQGVYGDSDMFDPRLKIILKVLPFLFYFIFMSAHFL